jgi:hypothetical protein
MFPLMRSPLFRLVAAIIAALITVNAAAAQTWSTGYFPTSAGYGPAGFSLDGAPTNAPSEAQWQTTDPYIAAPVDRGGTSMIFFTQDWTAGTPVSGNHSVLFGGYNANAGVLPGITNPFLYRAFDHTFGTATTTFSVDFGIIPSTGNAFYPDSDTFGFNLTTAGGSSLAAFQLSPTGALPGFLNVNWIQNGGAVATNGTTFKGFQIQYGGLYRLVASLTGTNVTMDISGLSTQTDGANGVTNYVVTGTQNIISNGVTSGGLDSSTFEVAGMTWDLTSGDPEQPGANYMIVNQVSVVPEPSTAGLLALGLGVAGTVFLRGRRKK